MKRLAVVLLVAALSVASAKTYRIRLFEPSVVSGVELKPGEYKLNVSDQKVVISQGKITAESAVKHEANGEKYSSTSVRYAVRDGKNHVLEIRLGGTNTKLVLN